MKNKAIKKKVFKSIDEVTTIKSGVGDPKKISGAIKAAKEAGEEDIVISADESKKEKKSKDNNPWAICTSSVGRKDKKKFEKCVKDIKKKNMDEKLQKLEEHVIKTLVVNENPRISKGDFLKHSKNLKEGKKVYSKYDLNMLNEAIEYDPRHPERMNPEHEDTLKNKNYHLKGHPSFPGAGSDNSFEEKVASKRFTDLVKKAKRYLGVETISSRDAMMAMQSLGQIFKIESSHKSELEKLAVDIVKKEFGIGDEIEFSAKLVNSINMEGMAQKPSEETIEFEDAKHIEDVDAEINKRKLINSLIQGASKKGHYMFHMVEDELNNIDPRLLNLYGTIMSINDLMLWLVSDKGGGAGESESSRAGKSYIDHSGDKPKIIAEAKIFPVLIHELVKGVMELMSTDSLPDDENLSKYVLGKADFVDAEIWDLRIGPGIWEKFLDAIGESEWDVRHYLYNRVTKMPAQEFNEFMKEILSGTKKGKQKLVDLANSVKKDIANYEYHKSTGGADYDPNDDDDFDIDDINIDDLWK